VFLASRQFYIADPGCDLKKHVDNIRFEFQMEMEQRYVVSTLHSTRMKLRATFAELAAVYHEDALDENRVKYWLRDIQLHRSDLSDRPLLENIDAQILQVLEAEPWSSVRSPNSLRFLRRRCISI
jgi:hypothetical protein